jgi:hypothetical protein
MSAAPATSLLGTLGSIEIGGVMSTLLFGIVTTQSYNYFSQYPRDSKPLKLLVSRVSSVVFFYWVKTCIAGGSDLVCIRAERWCLANSYCSRFLELGHTISTWHAVRGEV